MLYEKSSTKEWSIPPSEADVIHYDSVKMDYRRAVENFINPLKDKSLRKKAFYTISTNVLCADLTTKRCEDPANRDLYLPLEISITRWSLDPSKPPIALFHMLDPGSPTTGSLCHASDHKTKHKIQFDTSQKGTNQFIETDLIKIVKEINAFIGPDRTLFSLDLFKVRQDLGSLKWLKHETQYKLKPINVYSILDLYVVLLRRLAPDYMKPLIGLGFAKFHLGSKVDCWNSEFTCDYHNIEQNNTEFCAKCLSLATSHKLIEDVELLTEEPEESESEEVVARISKIKF